MLDEFKMKHNRFIVLLKGCQHFFFFFLDTLLVKLALLTYSMSVDTCTQRTFCFFSVILQQFSCFPTPTALIRVFTPVWFVRESLSWSATKRPTIPRLYQQVMFGVLGCLSGIIFHVFYEENHKAPGS